MKLVVLREELEDRELANYVPLQARGVSLEFVTSYRAGRYAGTGLGVAVTRLHQPLDVLGPFAARPRAVRELSRVVDAHRLIGLDRALQGADVVCVLESHMASSEQVCLLKRRRPTLRVAVVAFENLAFRYEDDVRLARRKDIVRAEADLFLAPTPEAREALIVEGVPERRIVQQPYGVDAARFSPTLRDDELRARWGAQPGQCVVLFAGRLIREKGLAQLLQACARLADHDFRIVLVGSGGEQPRLARIAHRLELTDHTTFVPWAPASDMPRVMASADIFAMPSLTTPYWEEQLGFSLIEAMASGAPIVSTRSGSIPFVVGPGASLVDPYDVDALASALGALLADPSLRAEIGRRGRARVTEVLDTEVVADGLHAAFSTLTG
jgi:glycosyltransferase involved in cell wall biosynthesis